MLLSTLLAVKLTFLLMKGPESLTTKDVKLTSLIVKEQYKKELNVNLKTIRIMKVRLEAPEIMTLGNISNGTIWNHWYKYIKTRYRRVDTIKMLILPPIYEEGLYWNAGEGSVCSYVNSNPFGWVALRNYDTLSKGFRYQIASTGIAHELGHVCCMTHDDSNPPSIMNSNALAHAYEGLRFSAKSKIENNC